MRSAFGVEHGGVSKANTIPGLQDAGRAAQALRARRFGPVGPGPGLKGKPLSAHAQKKLIPRHYGPIGNPPNVKKGLNPKNVGALARVARRAETVGPEQHRNLPIRYAKGKLKAHEAGRDLASRGGLKRT